jgi:hypothetical protein
MKSKAILIAFVTLIFLNVRAQQYFTKTGTVSFFSHTNLEDIEAENRKVVCVLDSKSGAMEFSLLMKSFDFKNDLMEQHFNESFAESSKFPKAGFKGKITNIGSVDFKKDGTYDVTYDGMLTLKDVTKNITGPATIVIKGGKITAKSKLKVRPTDYNFKIPNTAIGKIADEIDVDLLFDLIAK